MVATSLNISIISTDNPDNRPCADVYNPIPDTTPLPDPDEFFKMVKEDAPEACVLDTWEVRPQPTVPVTDLPCLSTPQAKIQMFIECHQCTSDRICSDECMNELYMAMEYTPDEIREIDIATRGQHLNPNWFLLRKYLLTASRFKTICHSINWTKTAVSLLNGNSYVSDDMEFGNRFEGICT